VGRVDRIVSHSEGMHLSGNRLPPLRRSFRLLPVDVEMRADRSVVGLVSVPSVSDLVLTRSAHNADHRWFSRMVNAGYQDTTTITMIAKRD
jgi:hypothetical protein